MFFLFLRPALIVGALGLAMAPLAAHAQSPRAAAAASSPVAFSAEEERLFKGMVDEWPGMLVHLPEKLPLDADMAARAPGLAAELRPALRAAAWRWLQEIRAAQPQAGASELALWLMARLNNETVSWLVSSPGAERETTEWRLAQQPGYCRERSALHENAWALLAERLLFLQPLQGPEREAAITAERRRWQTWLAGGLQPEPSPLPPPQLQAFQAAERQRGDEPVAAHGMTPWLSRFMLGERPPQPYANLMQDCALLQWWLVNEVQRASLNPQQAMRLFRHGTLPVNENLLWLPGEVRRNARAAKIDDYPPIAQRFEVTGATQLAVVLDAAGRVRDVQITARRYTMPGLAAGALPLAYEQSLDRASFARVRAMTFDKPEAQSLKNGVVRRELELLWKLN